MMKKEISMHWKQVKKITLVRFFVTFFMVLLLSGMFSALVYFIFHELGWWDLGGKEDFDVIAFHAVSLSLLTAGLIAVALIELSNTNKSLRGEFLLKIDERFGDSEIMEAETLIQQLCCEKGVKNINDHARIQEVGRIIAHMAKEKDNAKIFTRLLNFLDFLETIAYFGNQGLVSKKEIQELLGGTLIYYYKIFEPLMTHQRDYLCNRRDYEELKKMVGGAFFSDKK